MNSSLWTHGFYSSSKKRSLLFIITLLLSLLCSTLLIAQQGDQIQETTEVRINRRNRSANRKRPEQELSNQNFRHEKSEAKTEPENDPQTTNPKNFIPHRGNRPESLENAPHQRNRQDLTSENEIRRNRNLDRMFEGIDLSETQNAAIRTLRRDLNRSITEYYSHIQALQEQKKSAMRAGNENEAQQLVAEMKKIHSAISHQRDSYLGSINQILTPEQNKKLKTFNFQTKNNEKE